MGGAFISVAEGADGHLVNPASFTSRHAYAGDDWFNADATLSWVTVGVADETDLDLSGQPGNWDQAQVFQGGFNLKFGRHGVGAHIIGRRYTVTLDDPVSGERRQVSYEQTLGGLGYAYPFLDGDLTVGIVFPTGTASLSAGGKEIVRLEGGGVLVGGVWAPCGANFRVGATWRRDIVGRDVTTGVAEDFGEVVPEAIAVPSELGVGGSVMLGARRYNTCPSYGDWEQVTELPPLRSLRREYVLLAMDLVLTGASEHAIGVQSFIEQRPRASGAAPVLSVRAGAESELWSDLLVVRGGTYYEPSRFEDTSGRLHGTFGFDVSLFELIWPWKASFVADVAPRYTNVGFGLGIWH